MINKEAAPNMAVMVAMQMSQLEGVLLACDDSVERARIENALSALDSLFRFYEAAAK